MMKVYRVILNGGVEFCWTFTEAQRVQERFHGSHIEHYNAYKRRWIAVTDPKG